MGNNHEWRLGKDLKGGYPANFKVISPPFTYKEPVRQESRQRRVLPE